MCQWPHGGMELFPDMGARHPRPLQGASEPAAGAQGTCPSPWVWARPAAPDPSDSKACLFRDPPANQLDDFFFFFFVSDFFAISASANQPLVTLIWVRALISCA